LPASSHPLQTKKKLKINIVKRRERVPEEAPSLGDRVDF